MPSAFLTCNTRMAQSPTRSFDPLGTREAALPLVAGIAAGSGGPLKCRVLVVWVQLYRQVVS